MRLSIDTDVTAILDRFPHLIASDETDEGRKRAARLSQTTPAIQRTDAGQKSVFPGSPTDRRALRNADLKLALYRLA